MAFLPAATFLASPGLIASRSSEGVRYVLAHQRSRWDARLEHEPRPDVLPRDQHVDACRGRRHDRPTPSSPTRHARRCTKAVKLILMAQNLAKNPKTPAAGGISRTAETATSASPAGRSWRSGRPSRPGARSPRENIDRAVDYLKRCAVPGGGFAYQPGQRPNNPRTGTGILALEICGEHLSPEAVAGAEYLRQAPAASGRAPTSSTRSTTAPRRMFQMGDKYFLAYYPKLVPILLDHQERDGSWLSGDGNDRSGGRNYCTAMAVLALAVEYRYLPIYQR